MKFAYCHRDGTIEIAEEEQDENALFLGSGGSDFVDLLNIRARHGYNGELFVPGVPEAETDDDAFDAVISFRDQLIEAGFE